MKRPEVQTIMDKAIADMALLVLQACTHALCVAGHKYDEDEALSLVFQEVQASPVVHYLLKHTVTSNLVANKGVHQFRVDFLRSLYSRLVSQVAAFAQKKIENFRYTHFAIKARGTTDILEYA
jgi:hypothetical protein